MAVRLLANMESPKSHTNSVQIEVKWSASHSVVSDSLQPHGLYSPWNFPGQNTGVGSCSLLQGIFPTQRSNPGLPHCRWVLYQPSHQGNPRILEWAAYPFSAFLPNPGIERGSPALQAILYQLSYQGSPTTKNSMNFFYLECPNARLSFFFKL